MPATDHDWMTEAACNGVSEARGNFDLFFLADKNGAAADLRYGARICGGCPVVKECVEYAEDHGIKHGTWGGMTEAERNDLRRRFGSVRSPAGRLEHERILRGLRPISVTKGEAA